MRRALLLTAALLTAPLLPAAPLLAGPAAAAGAAAVHVGHPGCSDSRSAAQATSPSGAVCSLARAAALLQGGGRLVLAPGTHRGPLRLPSGTSSSPTVVVGGPGVTVSAAGGKAAAILSGLRDAVVRDVALTGGTSQAVWAESCTRVRLERVRVSGSAGPGVQVRGCTDLALVDSFVTDNASTGVQELGGTLRTTVLGGEIARNGRTSAAYNGDGVQLDGRDALLRGVSIRDNGSHALYEHGVYASGRATGYRIEDCTFWNNEASQVKAMGQGTVSGGRLAGGRLGVYVSGSTGSGAVLRGVLVEGDHEHGVLASDGAVLTVERSTVRTTGGGTALTAGAGVTRVVVRTTDLVAAHPLEVASAARSRVTITGTAARTARASAAVAVARRG